MASPSVGATRLANTTCLLLIVAYRLLAEFVAGTGQPMRVAAWEHPWIRSVRDARFGRTRHVRLPAAAVLVREDAAGQPPRLLQLPDVGTVPVASHRAVLRSLMELRRAEDSDEEDGPLLVVAVADPVGSGARAEAWRSLLGPGGLGNDLYTLAYSPVPPSGSLLKVWTGSWLCRANRCSPSSRATPCSRVSSSPRYSTRRGRFRPDGYGCRGPSRFGFFLEYDRGTERPVE
jgi:hypothetical protein